jgi:glycerol kinase
MSILALDLGTTGVTALVVDSKGMILSRGYQEFPQYFPKPGWVEHDLEEIWLATKTAIAKAGIGELDVTSIGITNQRETAAIWDRESLSSPTRAIVWQDRRTSEYTKELKDKNLDGWIQRRTGLGIDPYFTASKFLWWKRNLPDVWRGIQSGRYALGTIDSFIIAKLSGGKAHITDASNASRTQLMDLTNASWDTELAQAFEIPLDALPRITPSWGELAKTDPGQFFGKSVVISGIAGDQQAALFGQAAFSKDESKCTYGTGAFILRNTGEQIVHSNQGLLATVAWLSPSGSTTYATEGSVFIAGAAVQWLRDQLKFFSSAAEIEELAGSAGTSDGVVFIPAFVGMGAPFWDQEVRGSLMGLTRGSSQGNISFAVLEAIAFQVRAVMDAMNAESTHRPENLKVDGGAAANNLLLQLQADLLGVDVIRARNLESTGLGAAFLSGLGSGVWKSTDELKELNESERIFSPIAQRDGDYQKWLKALSATANF